jgi:hypothetical protein
MNSKAKILELCELESKGGDMPTNHGSVGCEVET